MTPEATDPVLAQRERIRTHANQAQRAGYLMYGAAMVCFFIGLATSFSGPIVTVIIALMIVGSIVLAVAIQVGYAIRGAERHEEDSIAMRKRR